VTPRAVGTGVLVLAAAALAGCAYTTSSALLPSHLRTVAIPVFENNTTQYSLEKEITDAVIAKFIADNHLKVVDERVANSVLRGKVVAYRNSVFGFTGSNRAQEYRVTITVNVVFKDQVKNREVWSDAELVKYSNYYVENVPGQTAKTELDGRKEAVSKIADEILSRTVEGW
jgi:outer membrane lipopolysaccharide assembly protein LptE/RlpB